MFRPDAQDAWSTEETLAVLSLAPQTVMEMLGSLKPERGIYRCAGLPTVVMQVVPSEIKDQDGKVIQVIG